MDDVSYIARRRCVGAFVAAAFYVALAGLFLIFVMADDAGVYVGRGFVYLCCGAVFAFAGLYVWRLFYAHEDEEHGDTHLLRFLSRAALQRQQKHAVAMAFFPDRFVAFALLAAGAYGVLGGFHLMRSYDDGFLLHDFMLQSGAFLMALLSFFAVQSLVQMFERGVLVVCSVVVLLFEGALFVNGISDIGWGELDVLFGVICGLLALRFLSVFKVQNAIYILLGLSVLAGVFIFYETLSIALIWSGFAMVGGVSGAVYRPRDREYRLYQV